MDDEFTSGDSGDSGGTEQTGGSGAIDMPGDDNSGDSGDSGETGQTGSGAIDMPDSGETGDDSGSGAIEIPEYLLYEDYIPENLFASTVKVNHDDYIVPDVFASDGDYRIYIKNKGVKYHSLTFCDPAIFATDSSTSGLSASEQIIGMNQKNTWYDWHLIPTQRVSIASPKLRTKYLEIPGYNGYIDLSNLTGGLYGEREGSISFYVARDKEYGYWADRKREIESYIHGRLLFMLLDEDPEWYYIGRWTFESWENYNDGTGCGCTFNYYLQPDIYSVSANNLDIVDYSD